jgi:glycosyltransferase involved in cell wall biosynthesis
MALPGSLKIGFDAKRAFFNRSGLGNYSRDTIRILSTQLPENEYFLYTPEKPDGSLFIPPSASHLRMPLGFFYSSFPSAWRSRGILKDLRRDKIGIFHGLSNEIPFNIHKSAIKSVVTIHDLIFLTHPQYFNKLDRIIYKRKFSYSAKNANAVIAVSRKTKEDIVNYFNINQDKIFIVHQGCDPMFARKTTDEEKDVVKGKYALPSKYLLCVGTIEERKNQLSIVKAIHEGGIELPLILIGKSTNYSSAIQKYIEYNNVKNVQFLHNIPTSDLPAIYQMAKMFIYPSRSEGFGIPVLEAIFSGIPVITSRGRSMEEAGGGGAVYIDPESPREIIKAIQSCLEDSELREKLIMEGMKHSLSFSDKIIAQNLMRVYNYIL